MGMALVGMAQVGMALVGMALVGMAQVGMALVGMALVGMAQVGMAQKHSTHFGSAAQTPHDECTSGRACLRRRHTNAPKWEWP